MYNATIQSYLFQYIFYLPDNELIKKCVLFNYIGLLIIFFIKLNTAYDENINFVFYTIWVISMALDFEKPIAELEAKLDEMKRLAGDEGIRSLGEHFS